MPAPQWRGCSRRGAIPESEGSTKHPAQPAGEPPLEAERKRRRPLDPPGEQRSHPLVAKTPQSELEHALRSGVDPLHVVDREQHRARLGQDPQGAEHRHGDRPLLGPRPLRLLLEERDRKSSPLRVGEGRKRRLESLLKEVA